MLAVRPLVNFRSASFDLTFVIFAIFTGAYSWFPLAEQVSANTRRAVVRSFFGYFAAAFRT
jgi:hypothetical protein